MTDQMVEILSGGGVAGVLGALLFKAMSIIEAKSNGKKNGGYLHSLTQLTLSLEHIVDALKEIKLDLTRQRTVIHEIRTEQIKEQAVEADRLLRTGNSHV
jgi:hypothetical protein